MRVGRLIGEVGKTGPGRVGLVLLVILVVASFIVVFTFPRNFGADRWGNPAVWADNPKSAPPAWTNLFARRSKPRHLVLSMTEPASVEQSTRATEKTYVFPFSHDADEAPTLLVLAVRNVEFAARSPLMNVSIVRPDGAEISLAREVIRGPRRGEEGPFIRHDEEPLRLVLGSDEATLDDLSALFAESYGQSRDPRDIEEEPLAALFGMPEEDGYTALRGDYELRLVVLTADPDDRIGGVKVVVGGSVFGAMGTDALGRDLAQGLLFGLPVALLIGVLTATVSTFLGMTLGMVSGYFGGAVDLILQRAADIVANVPLLPLLIFLVFIIGPHLWLILGILVAFSWPGLTIMVRSMVLQLRTGQEVDAARAMGASSARVIFRHILPHATSYLLAQLVFHAPSAILAEAGLSFLGLGDPSIPTWGQILEYGFRTGAVFLGYWWWVIPPGLMIVITALTFMLLALGLEPAVDPRLRRRRAWRS